MTNRCGRFTTSLKPSWVAARRDPANLRVNLVSPRKMPFCGDASLSRNMGSLAPKTFSIHVASSLAAYSWEAEASSGMTIEYPATPPVGYNYRFFRIFTHIVALFASKQLAAGKARKNQRYSVFKHLNRSITVFFWFFHLDDIVSNFPLLVHPMFFKFEHLEPQTPKIFRNKFSFS